MPGLWQLAAVAAMACRGPKVPVETPTPLMFGKENKHPLSLAGIPFQSGDPAFDLGVARICG